MTENMNNSSSNGSSVTTGNNCRNLTIDSAASRTMHSTPSAEPLSLQQNLTLLPDASPPPPPPTAHPPPRSTRNPKDIDNAEFVNRLLSATRITEFYSSNIAPHSFFYSEMLRSIVQSRNESADREQQQQVVAAAAATATVPYNSALHFPITTHQHRRNRKRTWQNRYSELRTGSGSAECGENSAIATTELDLKLEKIRRRDEKEQLFDENSPGKGLNAGEQKSCVSKSPLAVVLPDKSTGNMIFPHSSPPSWYQPYPPFFIDLRVSGHIYDNNNEAKAKGSSSLEAAPISSGLDPKTRQGSAFTVPPPSVRAAPMNLTTSHGDHQPFKEFIAKDRYTTSGRCEDDRDEKESRRNRGGGYTKSRSDQEEVIAVDDTDA